MKITFLGTGASEGIPALFCNCKLCTEAREKKIFHTRSQLLVNDDLLIDFPPDTYHRALNLGVNLSKIENILVTHSHSDHFYSEDFFMRGLWSSFMLPVEVITLHGNRAVRDIFERNGCARQKGSYVSDTQGELNGYTVFDQSSEYVVHRPFETFFAGRYKVTALPSIHIPTEDCFNYLVTCGDKTLLYATDTSYPRGDVVEFLVKNHVVLDAMIVDGTYGLVNCHEGHMDFFDNDRLRKEMINLGVLKPDAPCFLTHVFHGAAKDLESLEKAIPKGYCYPPDGYSLNI